MSEKTTMHEIRVVAAKRLFHAAMEFWGRCDPVPEDIKRMEAWLRRRDELALKEAMDRIFAEAEGD